MKRILLSFCFFTLIISCESNPEKEKVTKLLKAKIGNKIPFNEVKIAKIENGIGVIVDGNWCYWIDENDKIYCVNGSSKMIYNANNHNSECEDAPIKAMFSDIEEIAK